MCGPPISGRFAARVTHTSSIRAAQPVQPLSFARLVPPEIARKFGYLGDGYRAKIKGFDARRFVRLFESVRTITTELPERIANREASLLSPRRRLPHSVQGL